MDSYQQYIHRSRYARHVPSENRRETWDETVDRFIDNVLAREERLPAADVKHIGESIKKLEVMPSMRALMTAGPALDRDNVAGFNCAFTPIDKPKRFDEMLYILMCGTGVGFSVERKYIEKLPEVAESMHDVDVVIKVRDSKDGWASAYRQLIALLYSGQVPTWDLSKIRPAGTPLKTFGGRASGPEPLNGLFMFTMNIFKRASGRRLTSLEVHDLCCKVADVVVCGGVRRSALLSLSNVTDERMRTAKEGAFWDQDPQRAMANNSVCYTEKPDLGIFLREWVSLYNSKAGERGIFSRYSCIKQLPERRDPNYDFGTNPCSEIVLRPQQFCNLTEVVIRAGDGLPKLKRKVRLATILGTVQSMLTNFRYLSSEWQANTEEERLLGVSLTGIMDHPILSEPTEQSRKWLEAMREEAIKVNQAYSALFDIPVSTAITCVKPSGTVSQLVNSSSGIHQRYSDYYIRRVRGDIKDPLCKALIDGGVPYEVSVSNPTDYVFSFPIASPKVEDPRRTLTAVEQLNLWKHYDQHWCEHKPSCTIYVKENEWLDVAAWVYSNFDDISGISFFPKDDHAYQQPPYEVITEAQYNFLVANGPKDLDLNIHENHDTTTSSQELACTGGACEI